MWSHFFLLSYNSLNLQQLIHFMGIAWKLSQTQGSTHQLNYKSFMSLLQHEVSVCLGNQAYWSKCLIVSKTNSVIPNIKKETSRSNQNAFKSYSIKSQTNMDQISGTSNHMEVQCTWIPLSHVCMHAQLNDNLVGAKLYTYTDTLVLLIYYCKFNSK